MSSSCTAFAPLGVEAGSRVEAGKNLGEVEARLLEVDGGARKMTRDDIQDNAKNLAELRAEVK